MTIEETKRICGDKLNELRPLFRPHCELTFIMRNPKFPDTGTLMVSNDDPELLIEAIRALVINGQESPR